jgi:hypothetical protein
MRAIKNAGWFGLGVVATIFVLDRMMRASAANATAFEQHIRTNAMA